jgi:hypothetical protein
VNVYVRVGVGAGVCVCECVCACPMQDVQGWRQIFTEGAGFVTIVAGTFLLHTTKDMDVTVADLTRLTKDAQSMVSVSSSKDKWEMEALYTPDLEGDGRGRLTTGSNRR